MTSLREEYENVTIALSRARLIYDEFCTLFQSDENLDLLRSGADKFFALVFEELQESILVKLCKLTDPASQGRNRKNLTAQHFLLLDEVKSNPSYPKIESIYNNEIIPARDKVETYRNKYMVHSDYSTLMSLDGNKPAFSDIKELLESLQNFFGLISSSCLGETHIWGGLGPMRCGAGYLITLLKRA